MYLISTGTSIDLNADGVANSGADVFLLTPNRCLIYVTISANGSLRKQKDNFEGLVFAN